MKIKAQAVTAAAATVLLFATTSGFVLSSGSSSTSAEPLSRAAIASLKAAVEHPSHELTAYFREMDKEQPGSAGAFRSVLTNNSDTDTIRHALEHLIEANGALETTISSALSELAASAPRLAALTSAIPPAIDASNRATDGGRGIDNGNGRSNIASAYGGRGADGDFNGNGNGFGDPDASLPNPAAPGGRAGFGPQGNGQTLGNPFTRVGQNRSVDDGRNNGGPPGGLPTGGFGGGFGRPQNVPPTNGGQPNSHG